MTLSSFECEYNGKAKKPRVFIDDMFKGRDYKVAYSDNVNPGRGKIIVTYTEPDSDQTVISFIIRPAEVTGLKVAKTAKTTATLKWNKVEKADKYNVYRYNSTSKEYTKVATVTANSATVKGLKSGRSYTFCVRAVAKGYLAKSYSAKVTAKTK